MREEVITDPTVTDIIEYLKRLPPETKFHIRDPDTGWDVHIIHIEVDKDGCWFGGEYHEMN